MLKVQIICLLQLIDNNTFLAIPEAFLTSPCPSFISFEYLDQVAALLLCHLA